MIQEREKSTFSFSAATIVEKHHFLLLKFHLFLDFLKKVVKRVCYIFKKGGEVRVGGWLKKGRVKTCYQLLQLCIFWILRANQNRKGCHQVDLLKL